MSEKLLPYDWSLSRDVVSSLTTTAQYVALDADTTIITVDQTAGSDIILCKLCTASTAPTASVYDFIVHPSRPYITKQEVEKFTEKWYTRIWFIVASGSGNAVTVLQY